MRRPHRVQALPFLPLSQRKGAFGQSDMGCDASFGFPGEGLVTVIPCLGSSSEPWLPCELLGAIVGRSAGLSNQHRSISAGV